MKKILLTAFAALGGLATGYSQTLYNTSFSTYTAGALVGQNGWTAMTTGAGTNPIQVTGVNAVIQSVSGEDDNVAFSTAFSGTDATVTATLAGLQLTTAGTGGSYFFALAGGLGNTSYTGRLYAKSTSGGFLLGIIPGNSGTVAYGTAAIAFNTPITLAINYGYFSGTGNDTLSISVNGALYSTYSTAFDFGVATGTSATLGSALFRQDNATSTGALVPSINVVATAAVPEPGAVALVSLGLGAMLFGVRRRRA